MPLLNVSPLLLDPDFADTFDVKRRTETIGSNGRSTVSEQTFSGIIGVVTANSPSDLDRQEGYQSMTRSISVVSKFRLRGETTNQQPDIVLWRGSNYVVKHVDLYPQFGEGFVQAECSSMDRTDPAIEPDAPGGVLFNSASNSIFASLIG